MSVGGCWLDIVGCSSCDEIPHWLYTRTPEANKFFLRQTSPKEKKKNNSQEGANAQIPILKKKKLRIHKRSKSQEHTKNQTPRVQPQKAKIKQTTNIFKQTTKRPPPPRNCRLPISLHVQFTNMVWYLYVSSLLTADVIINYSLSIVQILHALNTPPFSLHHKYVYNQL